MLVIFVSSFFCIFNIVLWIFFLSKYKKYFSTDDIIESTRNELNHMIADVNRNAGRNIDIIEEKIRELRSVVAEADRHLAFAQSELAKQGNLTAFQQRLENPVSNSGEGHARQNVAAQYRKNSKKSHSEDTYSLTAEGNRHVQPKQAGLFDQFNMNEPFNQHVLSGAGQSKEIISDSGTIFAVKNTSVPVTSVPVLDTGPEITFAENPIEPKKNFRDLVHDLHIVGHSVEEIAAELNSSTTEVQMVLDMDF